MFKKLLVYIFISTSLFSDFILEDKDLENIQKIGFITFDKVGISKNISQFPFIDCVGSCENVSNWSVPLNSSFLTKVKENNEFYLLDKEFDVINLGYNGFQFEVDEKLYLEKVDTTSLFNETLPFEKYKIEILNYINRKDFKESFKKIVFKSIKKRLTIKSNLLPSNKLKNNLLKKNYLIALYVQNINGEFRAVQSRKDRGFNLITDVDLILKAVIYRFNPQTEKFKVFKTVEGKSLNIDITSNLKELYSINYFNSEFDSFPNRFDGVKKFREEFQVSFQEAYKEIIDKIYNMDIFRNFSPIIDTNKNYIKFNQIRKVKFLRIDAPIYLQNIKNNGAVQNLAWGKVINIEKNNSGKAEAKVIENLVKNQDYDYTFLPNWNGLLYGLNSSYSMFDLINGEKTITAISEISISGDVAIDLGYIFNIKQLSEIWLNFAIYTGTEYISENSFDHISNISPNYLLRFETGLDYKYYFNMPIFVSLGFDIGSKFSEYDIHYFNSFSNQYRSDGDGKLNLSSYYLKLKSGIGYSFKPNLEIYSYISFRYHMFGESSIEENGRVINQSEMDYVDSSNFKYGNAIDLSLGLKYSF